MDVSVGVTQKIRLVPWLEDLLLTGNTLRSGDLSWVDRSTGVFQIRWYSYNRAGQSRTDDNLFYLYAKMYNKESKNPPEWKNDLRATLNTLEKKKTKKIKFIEENADADSRVYQFLEQGEPKDCGPARPDSPTGPCAQTTPAPLPDFQSLQQWSGELPPHPSHDSPVSPDCDDDVDMSGFSFPSTGSAGGEPLPPDVTSAHNCFGNHGNHGNHGNEAHDPLPPDLLNCNPTPLSPMSVDDDGALPPGDSLPRFAVPQPCVLRPRAAVPPVTPATQPRVSAAPAAQAHTAAAAPEKPIFSATDDGMLLLVFYCGALVKQIKVGPSARIFHHHRGEADPVTGSSSRIRVALTTERDVMAPDPGRRALLEKQRAGEKLTGDETAEKVCLPDFYIPDNATPPAADREVALQQGRAILSNMKRGLQIKCVDGDVFALRISKAAIVCRSAVAGMQDKQLVRPKHDDTQLPLEKVFDYKDFARTGSNPVVNFAAGERLKRNNLVKIVAVSNKAIFHVQNQTNGSQSAIKLLEMIAQGESLEAFNSKTDELDVLYSELLNLHITDESEDHARADTLGY